MFPRLLFTLFFLLSPFGLGRSTDVYSSKCRVTWDKELNGTKVDCKGRKLSIFPKLPPDTVIANLSQNNFTKLSKHHFEQLAQLRVLRLSQCRVMHVEEDAFQPLKKLNELYLEENALKNASPKLFNPLKELVKLRLSGNKNIMGNVHDPSQREMFRSLENLEELHLASVGLIDVPNGMFSGNRNLSEINLSNNMLTRVPEDITLMPRLKTLYLGTNRISSIRLNGSLTTTPRLRIHLGPNKIAEITRDDIRPYIKIKGLSLYLSGNKITHVAVDAFIDFKAITLLDFSNNPLCRGMAAKCPAYQNITESLRSVLVSTLQLKRIGLRLNSLTGDFFFNLRNSKLNKLSLEGNQLIYEVREDALTHLKHLTDLNLNKCSVTSYQAASHDRLTTLTLSSNQLTNFQNITSLLTKYPNLMYLIVSNNHFKVTKTQIYRFENHSALKTLVLSENSLFAKLVFTNLTSLQCLKMSDIAKDIGANSYDMSKKLELRDLPNLTKLLFDNNKAYMSKNASIFNGVPALKELCLNNNQLYRVLRIGPSILRDVFKPLHHLDYLSLVGNKLPEIPLGIFDGLAHLTKLHLSDNQIQSLPTEIFRKQSHLAELYLDSNFITTLSADTFKNLVALKVLNFAKNKIRCDCDIRSFQGWLATTSVDVQNPGELCFAPAWAQKTPIKDLHFSWFSCDNHTEYFAGISGGCLLFLVFLSTSLYLVRWDIRYMYALYRVSRRGRLQSLKEFDAIIGYCTASIAWIKKYLISNLERGENIRFKLCIRDRDFLVGPPLVDIIETNMEKSRQIIFLMTKEYMSSQTFDTEINLAQVKLFDGFVDKVIFIFLEKIEKKTIQEPLSTMLRHGCCLKWPEKGRAREKSIFWKRLKLSLLDSKHSPVQTQKPTEKTPILINENSGSFIA